MFSEPVCWLSLAKSAPCLWMPRRRYFSEAVSVVEYGKNNTRSVDLRIVFSVPSVKWRVRSGVSKRDADVHVCCVGCDWSVRVACFASSNDSWFAIWHLCLDLCSQSINYTSHQILFITWIQGKILGMQWDHITFANNVIAIAMHLHALKVIFTKAD